MSQTGSESTSRTIDPERIPAHIGIIMDGNGRWAKLRGMSRTQGHKEGLESAKKLVKKASDLGVKFVTLYTFSTENWKRAADEVGFLMSLIKTHLRAELAFYAENGIRVCHMGDLAGLPPDIAAEIIDISEKTSHYQHTTVVLAINYGGQDEIIRAIRKIPADQVATMTSDAFSSYLDIPALPPMDLLIRTGGEMRISNFLLWQSAYAELYFSDALWPDWTGSHLEEAIVDYQSRDRRYGAVK
jgi:undecaprenyl diphosphate synthase